MVRKKIKKRRKKLKIRNKSLGKKPDKLKSSAYSAKDIDVLEGLDPVKKRPAMYIGNTSTEGLHHLASEILDNAMDEAVDGHASKISVNLQKNNLLAITDDGRGIPVDKHPKLKKSDWSNEDAEMDDRIKLFTRSVVSWLSTLKRKTIGSPSKKLILYGR